MRQLPAFFFFRNGEKLDMFVGPQAQQLGVRCPPLDTYKMLDY